MGLSPLRNPYYVGCTGQRRAGQRQQPILLGPREVLLDEPLRDRRGRLAGLVDAVNHQPLAHERVLDGRIVDERHAVIRIQLLQVSFEQLRRALDILR